MEFNDSRPSQPVVQATGAFVAFEGKRKSIRKSRPSEPAGLELEGVLEGWNRQWGVGSILCGDGRSRPVSIGAFGPGGLAKAAAGARVRYALSSDGRVVACAPMS
jgi:hypothetical protein